MKFYWGRNKRRDGPYNGGLIKARQNDFTFVYTKEFIYVNTFCQAQPKVQTKATAFGWDGYNIITIQPPTNPPTQKSMKETE